MMLLYKHICDNREQGSPLAELVQVLPSLSERRVKYLLKQLKDDGKIETRGGRRWAHVGIPKTKPKAGINEFGQTRTGILNEFKGFYGQT